MSRKSWPDPPPRSPLSFAERSNGEFVPRPMTSDERRADALVHRLAGEVARRTNTTRRSFLASQLGTVAALSVVNTLSCRRDRSGSADLLPPPEDTGPFYDVPTADTGDVDALCEDREIFDPDVFVLDLQTHHIDDTEGAPWMADPILLSRLSQFGLRLGCEAPTALACINRSAYIDAIFNRSQTAVAVLTTPPAPQDAHPLDNEQLRDSREIVNALADSQRLLVHAGVLPNSAEGTLDNMARIVADLAPDAWKVYTQWGPEGVGWFFDDDVGQAFCERLIAIGGSRIVCAHKGLPSDRWDPRFASPRDVGPAAAMFPEIQFVIYHSARDNNVTEGPYTKETADLGSNRLVESLLASGHGPNGTVWAELGSAWNSLATKPDQAAHLLGKMLLYVGEDRVVWGTDCLWQGSPQPFIDAFWAFQIPEAMREKYGYPELTDDLKRKILGLNGAALHGIDPDAVRCALAEDTLSQIRARSARRGPAHRPHGPAQPPGVDRADDPPGVAPGLTDAASQRDPYGALTATGWRSWLNSSADCHSSVSTITVAIAYASRTHPCVAPPDPGSIRSPRCTASRHASSAARSSR